MPASSDPADIDSCEAGKITSALLAHYDAHARQLPWRTPPGANVTPDPYRVWLSEIMLQQTTVAAATPYFTKFTGLWPSVKALAQADEADVMAAWAGLGYYSRARNLVKCARYVAAKLGGQFPSQETELASLPGIGPYTAAAISAIAFGRRAVVVDANIERVVARLFAISKPMPAAKPTIRTAADKLFPDVRSGDLAQAMMDLGATVCTSRNPSCLICPLRVHCRGLAAGEPQRFPVKTPKKDRPTRQGVAWWIVRDDKVWLVRRPPTGMLGGMRALPDNAWHAGGDGQAGPPLPLGQWHGVPGRVRHVFSHFALELEVRALTGKAPVRPTPEGEWWPLDNLEAAGLPTVFAKAARLAMKEA